MKKNPIKVIIVWGCLLLYLVVGGTNMDSADVAIAKGNAQTSLQNSIDEYVFYFVLSNLGLVSKDDPALKEIEQGKCPPGLETGFSLEGAHPTNYTPYDFNWLSEHDVVLEMPFELTHLLESFITTERFSRPPPLRIDRKLASLRTIRLLI